MMIPFSERPVQSDAERKKRALEKSDKTANDLAKRIEMFLYDINKHPLIGKEHIRKIKLKLSDAIEKNDQQSKDKL